MKTSHLIIWGFMGIVFAVAIYAVAVFVKNNTIPTNHTKVVFNKQEVEQILFETRIEHPEVVFAQIILESDSMQSKIAVENNNILSIKMPAQRPTLAIGIKNGHALFRSVRDCILDYIILQQIYYRNLSEDEYLNKLAENYAQDPDYKKKLLKIMSQ